ncbi:hypothetical protein ACQCT3_19430 [Sutcliffiella horikoshii]|uniref:hypothetical protein n=1 Tax=Sutcliffiella horikoshii TaxID=79883 RepID=UPI003CEC6417
MERRNGDKTGERRGAFVVVKAERCQNNGTRGDFVIVEVEPCQNNEEEDSFVIVYHQYM